MASAFAGISGDTVNATYYYPDSSSLYQDLGTQVISGLGNTYNFDGYFDLLVTDTQIIAKNFIFASYWSPSDFNGFKVTDLTKNFSSIYQVDSATTMAGLTNANLSTAGNSFSVNWQGLSFNQDTQVVLNAVSAVPEPETYGMMLAGLGLMGFMVRRRAAS